MQKRIISYSLIILVTWLLAGCSVVESMVSRLFAQESVDVPVFMDDFSNRGSNWSTAVTDEGIVNYDGDTLRILINQKNSFFWSTPELEIADSVVNASTVKLSGPDDNLYGLICRMQDDRNYYAFLISSDGYYGIVKVENGFQQILGPGMMGTTDLVQAENKINHIRADCDGNELTFYLNWEKLTSVTDESFAKGKVGVIAGTLENIGTDIRFDNFIVLKPKSD